LFVPESGSPKRVAILISNYRYLWVALQMNNICAQPTDKAILNALTNIPKDLPQTFNRILQRLQNSEEYTSLAAYTVTLFRIVAAARRPLTLEELRETVSVEQGETAWDPDQLVNNIQKLINCCGSLLVVDEEDFTVRFIHQSVRQFLCSQLVDESVKEYEMNLASADLDLGMICVTYLNSERHVLQLVKQKPQLIASSATVRKAVPSSNLAGKLAIRLLNNKKNINHSMRPSLEATGALSSSIPPHDQSYNQFLPYAQENWLYHTTQLFHTTHPRIWHLWKRLVTGETRMVQLPWSPEDCIGFGPAFIVFVLKTHHWSLISMFIGNSLNSALINLKPVYDILKAQVKVEEHSLAKSKEIQQLLQLLEPCMYLEHDNHNNLRDSPALHAAAYMGLLERVQLLLESGADVNFQGGYHGTALQAACIRAHEVIVKLLLKNGAEVNLQGGDYGTALQAACEGGHEAIVKLLLENGADVNLQGGYYGTAMKAAQQKYHTDIVKLLLEYGATNE
jgi:hypothetical protein